jgi:pimeloyl-ACP methyl ester carboxylesterase
MLAFLLAATLLTPGSHAVAYRAEVLRDATRAGRTVYVQVWYPATPSKAAVMPYSDYFRDVPEPLRKRSMAIHEHAARTYGGNTEKLFASTTNAVRDGEPAKGSFPLIVYGGGAGNSIDENAALGEYLASNGFLFVAVPATGHSSLEITLDAAGLETEARDMELAAEWGRRLPSVAADKWIAGGFSFGGAAAIVVANRQPDVKAVFLLDSSTTSKQYSPLVAAAPFFDPERLTASVLDLHRKDETVTYDVLDRFLYSQRRSFDIEGPKHIDFNAFPLLYAPGSQRARGYEWIARTVHSFVQGKRMFRDSDVYPSKGRGRDAIPAPPPASELEEFARIDPAAATRIYEELRKREPQPSVIAPASINRIGYALLNGGDAAAAREVFLWNVRAHPKNADWLDSLGDALLKTNEKDCARAVFTRIAALPGSDSLRERARRELKALPGASTTCKYLEGLETR